MLVQRADVKAKNSRALQQAVKAQFFEAIDVLYPLSHPKKALKALQQKWPDNSEKWDELERRLAHEQHQNIERKITSVGRTVVRKKI